MLKFLRWLSGLVLTLALLLLLAVIIIPNVIDPNDYRDELSALVKDKTGRDLRLSGDLKVSVFPWLGVKTQGLSLSQPEGIEGDMLSVTAAQLRVKLAPLLRRKVEVDTVVLEAPMINLVTLKNGTDSFSGLTDSSQSNSSEASAELEEESATAAVALVIQGVELSNGTVVIDNRQEGSLTKLTNLNLVTGDLIGDSLADIKASGQMSTADTPELTQFDLSAKARIDTATLDMVARDLVAKINHGEFDVDLGLESMSLKQLAQIDVIGLTVALKGSYPAQMTMPALSANLDSQDLSVERLSAKYKNVDAIVSNLKVTQFIDKPSATGALLVPAFDAKKLLAAFAPEFKPSDPMVLKSVGLSADFAANLEGALVQKLSLNIDDTKLAGSASLVNYEKPKFNFDLKLTDMNLDRYLPKTIEGQQKVSGGEALAVPMAMFKDINANGSFKANSLTSGGVVLTDIDVTIKSSPGNVSITPKAKLYEGQLGGAIVFSQVGEKSSLKVKNQIDLVQLSPLLTAAIDSEMLRGIGTLDLDLEVTEEGGVQRNQGTIKLRAKDGALSGIDIYNIVGKLNSAATLYSSFSASDEPEQAEVKGKKSDNTEFSDLIGTFYLKDFLMTNDDLKFVGPGFEITGAGQFNLDQESLDYQITLVIQDSITGVAGDGVQQLLGPKLSWLSGKKIPIRCRGSFESPVCLPDVKALYSFYLGSKLEQKKSDLLQQKLGIKAEDGKTLSTKDVLQQLLLKRATKAEGSQGQASNDSREIPIGERDAEPSSEDAQGGNEPAREKTKKELRDERKRKLLESIFNKGGSE